MIFDVFLTILVSKNRDFKIANSEISAINLKTFKNRIIKKQVYYQIYYESI
jgi:hypothetical protein